MQSTTRKFLLPALLAAALVAGVLLLWPASPAEAQCGSQASSCKSCHEVQGQLPVNSDGTTWHQSHAFGDFCQFCHAGNVQSLDKVEAHLGMVPPLSDVQAGCSSCHMADYTERAQVYAGILGVEIGAGGSVSGGSGSSAPAEPAGEESPASEAPALVVADPSQILDFNQQYDETVLGKRNINWGDVVVALLIAAMLGGGGFYVYQNERKIAIAAGKVKPAAEKMPVAKKQALSKDEEIAALLPALEKLTPVGLHALKRLLEDPQEASELLHSLSRLDPELVRRMRQLDHSSRSLLFALAGD